MSYSASRRSFLKMIGFWRCTSPVCLRTMFSANGALAARKMRLCLSPGAIGVKAGQRKSVELAARYGFEAVEPSAGFLADSSESGLKELLAEMKGKGITFGAAGLPVNFRGDDSQFRGSLASLPARAAACQRAGVGRVATWLSPGHNSLTYLENLRRHGSRLREVARILRDHNQRLGLEYVGTPSARQHQRYPFIHSMREMRELIREIGLDNVGLVLDSWHWWTAGDTEAELLALKNSDVVSVDINDAPAGVPLDQQLDGQRELPCATGVIPLGTFLNALVRIGYDGPVRAEPFNKALSELSTEKACAATIGSLRKAMALLKD